LLRHHLNRPLHPLHPLHPLQRFCHHPTDQLQPLLKQVRLQQVRLSQFQLHQRQHRHQLFLRLSLWTLIQHLFQQLESALCPWLEPKTPK
jgi:hypothetical protein